MKELTRATEELKAVNEGDVRYLAWLQEVDEHLYRQLTEMPVLIQRFVSSASAWKM